MEERGEDKLALLTECIQCQQAIADSLSERIKACETTIDHLTARIATLEERRNGGSELVRAKGPDQLRTKRSRSPSPKRSYDVYIGEWKHRNPSVDEFLGWLCNRIGVRARNVIVASNPAKDWARVELDTDTDRNVLLLRKDLIREIWGFRNVYEWKTEKKKRV